MLPDTIRKHINPSEYKKDGVLKQQYMIHNYRISKPSQMSQKTQKSARKTMTTSEQASPEGGASPLQVHNSILTPHRFQFSTRITPQSSFLFDRLNKTSHSEYQPLTHITHHGGGNAEASFYDEKQQRRVPLTEEYRVTEEDDEGGTLEAPSPDVPA